MVGRGTYAKAHRMFGDGYLCQALWGRNALRTSNCVGGYWLPESTMCVLLVFSFMHLRNFGSHVTVYARSSAPEDNQVNLLCGEPAT